MIILERQLIIDKWNTLNLIGLWLSELPSTPPFSLHLIHTRWLSDFCRLQLCNEMIFMTPKFRLHSQNSFHQFDFLWNSRLLSLQNNHTDKNQNIFRNFLKPVKDVIVNFSGYVFRQARNQRAACLKTGFDFKTKSSFKNNRSCKVFKVCFGWRIRNKLFKSRVGKKTGWK